MLFFQKDFQISNPSQYKRSDYVQIDLIKLQVPPEIDGNFLSLFRLDENVETEIPFQIDYPFGTANATRIISFLSNQTPSGLENYSEGSLTFRIKTQTHIKIDPLPNLKIEYYYATPQGDEPTDGFSRDWYPYRQVNDIKLINDLLEVNLRLTPSHSPGGLSYVGGVTSISLPDMHEALDTGDILSPFDAYCPEKLWGQLSELVFYPLPWEHRQFFRYNMREQKYDVVWARSGPIRAVVALKSQPFVIPYDGNPFFPGSVNVTAHLYRLVYLNNPIGEDDHSSDRERPHYIEELYVLTENGTNLLNFRPYYFSCMPFGDRFTTNIIRLENIPDFFSIWKRFGGGYFGYGFAADAHVRWVQTQQNEVSWRLPLTQNCRCVHYFMFELMNDHFDQLHTIGHKGWYEKVYKPLRSLNEDLDFPTPLE
jgi:hypothetical protein